MRGTLSNSILYYSSNKLSSYLWSNKLKSGCIDKLKKLDIGNVEEYYYIGICREENNPENNDIIEYTEFEQLTKYQHDIIKEIEHNCTKRFRKKSVVLFSKKERRKLNKIIGNELGFKENIFYFTKYRITVNMSDKEIQSFYTEEECKEFRREIFYEFYKRYIVKHIDTNITKFTIFVRLFNYYLHKNSIVFELNWMPFDKSEKNIYLDEIKKLEKGVRELNEEIKHLQQEMKLKT